jgi:undecaprenyl pyrophosphate phosphatase UppP
MNQKQKEKGADLLLDIIKYIITAVVLTTFFGDFAKWEWYWYVIVAAIILLMTSISISVYKEDNKKKK